MIRRKESENKKEKDKTKKYIYQLKLTRPRRWLDLDHEWLEENFMTREPDLYKTLSK